MMSNVGILGVGAYLPPEVRGNDWWPPATVAQWMERRRPPGAAPTTVTPAIEKILAALGDQASDPFQGARARHVMPPEMSPVDMEEAAAAQALRRAGCEVGDIDLLLSHTAVPDELLSNPACVLHARLGLPAGCPAWQLDASSYSFLGQLALAEAMVQAGRARKVLLVQSSAATRLIDPQDPVSVLFGDGATAVVVGAVEAGAGILASVHRTDGRWARTLVASVPKGRWYDDGRPVINVADPAAAREVFLFTVDRGKEVSEAVLRQAGYEASDVEFFGVHQGAPWLAAIARDCMGLHRARMVDVFSDTAHMFASSIPLSLSHGEERGLLTRGTLVLLFGGGTGMTYGATLLRWGAV